MLILTLLLVVHMVSAGDIATSNCPTGYSISSYNITSASSVSFNQQMGNIYSSFRGSSNANRVQSIVTQGNTNDLYSFMLSMSYPFIAIGCAFLVVFITVIACCVCDKSCPPCQNWKRDFVKRPYQKMELRCVTVCVLIFAVAAAGFAIFAFTAMGSLRDSLSYTKCGVFVVMDSAINGDTSNNWGGFTFLNNVIGNISTALSSTTSNLSTYFPDNTWLSLNTVNLSNMNQNIYTTYNASVVATPNPLAYGSSSSSVSTNTTPWFILSSLGPNGTANTMVTDIDTALRQTQKLTAQAISTDLSAKILLNGIGTIQTNLNLTTNEMTMYNTQLANVNTNLNTFSSTYFDQVFSWGIYVIQAVVGFTLAAALLAIMGSTAAHCFDIYNCRILVHLSWVIFGIVYFGVVGLAYVFVPGGIIATDFCTYYNSMLTNPTSFQLLNSYYSQNVFGNLQNCIFSDGNVLKSFNANTDINTIMNLFSNITLYQSMVNSSSTSYVDTSLVNTKIATWNAILSNYQSGYYNDSNPSDTTDSNVYVALNNLNLASYTGIPPEHCAEDLWVLEPTNCTLNTWNNGPSVGANTPVCMPFNSVSTGYTWNQSAFNARYISIKNNCPTSYSTIISYGFSIITYQTSRISLYKSITADLTSLNSQYSAFLSNHSTFQTNVNSFYNGATTLRSLINDQLSGINVTKNCTIIGNNLRFVYNEFCVNFMNQAYKLAIAFVLLMAIIVGCVITASVFAIRYAKVEKDAVQVMPQEPHSSENFGKQSQVSSEDND